MVWELLFLGVGMNAGAQLLLKIGMNRIGYFDFSLANLWPIGVQVATNPPILLGLFTYVFSVMLWLLVLSRVEVSVAYPMVSLGYVLNAAIAYYLLGEPVTLMRLVGILIIITGVYLVARSA